MSKKIFIIIIVAIYAMGLTISGPLKVVAGNPIKPISGNITLYITGHIRVLTSPTALLSPVSGAKVTLVSTNKKRTFISETQTDKDGSYNFEKLGPGKYIVQPQDAAYTFSPSEQLVHLIRMAFSNIDFLAIPRSK